MQPRSVAVNSLSSSSSPRTVTTTGFSEPGTARPSSPSPGGEWRRAVRWGESSLGKKRVLSTSAPRVKKLRLVDCSDSDDDSWNNRTKVTPPTSSDGSEDEKEIGECHAAVRALVRTWAPRLDARHRDKFEAYYNDSWISRHLAQSRADPRSFVESFRRNLEARFPLEVATTSSSICDRCDGRHETARCPHFSNDRDDHPDAARRRPPAQLGSEPGNAYLREARIVQQPGDGSCLFHSLAYSYNHAKAARLESAELRVSLMDWLVAHEEETIAETPIKDWVRWDANATVAAYAKRMRYAGWGGGIEMAAFARKFACDVHVYERACHSASFAFKRISRFEATNNAGAASKRTTLTLLYCGGVHYNVLLPLSPPVELPPNASKSPLPSPKASPLPRPAIWRDSLSFARHF